ncbi:hypothetical protein LTR56_013065 [Elasticomyces elasticus]|nr:hypothetical protein LTR56_013065 [Elasticomyces elasticus]KAK3640244.1 hypothetical protein LTR22_017079 [Elasticomyces elasticus]KAK4920521.1 hypothetical protein LTR49_011936 [Elasticomyces elasticus]KAK5758979.1 hypothetical protein LTS12_010920 [Elasticomyces elasticus]
MLPALHIFGISITLIWLIYKLVITPAFFSPLSKLPAAHWSSHLSARWFDRKCATAGELKTLYATHQRLGPIVRLGPNEVSVVSEEGLKKVYTAGLDKSNWYDSFRVYGVQNLVCTLDHKTHSAVRKTIAGLYSKSFLQHSEALDGLSERIVVVGLLPSISRGGCGMQGMDVVKLFECVGVDFITGYVFGATIGTDFLNDQTGRDRYFDEWERLRETPGLTEKPITESLFMDMCKAAVTSGKASVAAKMHQELSSKAMQWNLSEEKIMTRCASEMVDHIIATQETNTVTLTYILYRLSQHPEYQEQLRDELHDSNSHIPNREDRPSPNPADIDTLPLLHAIVTETLRLHAANPARMRRVSPPAGLDLHGVFIPPATILSTNAYCLHRNPDVFPKPFDWLPERWLASSDDKTDASGTPTMRRWFWAFGSGSRGCVGREFAVQIIKLVVAAIYEKYTTVIVDEDGIEQSDSYNSGPISHKLVLRFVPVLEAGELVPDLLLAQSPRKTTSNVLL